MFLFIIGVLVALAGIVLLFVGKIDRTSYEYGQVHHHKFNVRWIGITALIVAVVLVAISCCVSISTGYTGILTTFGRVENETLDAGLNFKAPWQSVVKMNNQEQREAFELEAFSSDIQQVNISGSINYNIDKATAMTLYREVGTSYVNTLVTPRLYENTKAVFSKYKAEDLIVNREVLSVEILNAMKVDLEGYGVNVLSISIEDVDFTDEFTNAVEAKQVASQNKLRAETEQEQATMEANAAAERKLIEAEAQAEVNRINADAEAYRIGVQAQAEAEANRQIAESLSEDLIEYKYANVWDGELPATFVGNGETIPVIQTVGTGE